MASILPVDCSMYPAVWESGPLDLANGSAVSFLFLVAGLDRSDLVCTLGCGKDGVQTVICSLRGRE